MKKRVISAVVALAIIIPLIALGGIYFKIGMAVLSILSMYEILKLRKELPIFIKVPLLFNLPLVGCLVLWSLKL